MGLNIFLVRVREVNGKEEMSPFETSVVTDILGDKAVFDNEGTLYGVQFPDEPLQFISMGKERKVSNMSFDGGTDQYIQMIWDIADRTQSCIFWESNPQCSAVTSDEALKLTPEGLRSGLGKLKIVSNGRELSEYIARGDIN